MNDRRKPNLAVLVHQYIVTILLLTILIVGFFHYFSLNANQKNLSKDIEEFRLQYVKIQLYLVGQTEQDKKIEDLQNNIAIVKKLIKEKYAQSPAKK